MIRQTKVGGLLMANNRSRYREMEQLMTTLLISDTIIFILYLIVSGVGILWLKILTAFFAIAIAAGSLVLLCLSKELLKPRSMWMSAGFFSVLACMVASLILAFP